MYSSPGPSAPISSARFDRQAWRRSAACRQIDSELFFPVGSTGTALQEINRAKAVCSTCPVREACLGFALSTNQEFGVWGGCDEDERRVMRRQRRTDAQAASA